MRLAAAGSSSEGSEKEELVGGTAEKRNWRGIIISLLVILLICSLIIVAIIIATPEDHVYEKFTFDDVFDPTYQPSYYSLVWISEDEYIHRSSTNNIVSVNINTNETEVLVTNRTMDDEEIVRIWVKPDKEYILMSTQEEQLYRSSFFAIYKIYHVASKSIVGTVRPPGLTGNVPLRYAAWAPDGSALVFVYKNNLYYQDNVLNDPVAVTQDGVEGEIFNGVPDWVYEEEILSSDNAIYWLKDSSRLVFASFNDTQVPKAWYPTYDNKIYSKINYYAYPKPGFTNPTVQLYAVNLANLGNLVKITPPTQFHDQDHYYTSVVWKDNYQVAVTWLNRPQNVSLTTLCQADSGVCDVVYEQQTTNGWIVRRGDIIFAADGMSYYTILPQREGALGRFYHIAQITSEGGQRGDVTFLTQGSWEVTQIVGYNRQGNVLYFISTEVNPANRTLYSIKLDGTHQKSCITCDISNNCSYYSALFNNEGTRFFLQCQGPWLPRSSLHSVASPENYTMLEDNAAVSEAYEVKDYNIKTYLSTKSRSGDYDIKIELLVPRELDSERKHPLLVEVYGGPGSQSVDTKFQQGWYTYLTSNYHILVARIDGRGSGYRGEKLMYEVYRRLGTVEIEDQVTAAMFLAKDKKFIDLNKTAIWGWSYGGFASTLAATHNFFNCTIAVAPVTDWRFYDSVYTERYMGMPRATDNLQAYKDSNVSSHVSELHNTKYLLVHGLADDNVQFQHSANLVRSLVQEGVYHQVQYYTDENHELLDPMVQRDLYKTMTDFLVQCLDLEA